MQFQLKTFLLIWFAFLPYSYAGSANALALDSAIMPFNLAPKGMYLVDPEGKMTIEDIRKSANSSAWQKYLEDVPNFGFTDVTVWAKYQIRPTDDAFNQSVIEIGYPLLDQVDFYLYLDGTQYQHYELGDIYPFHDRPVKHRHFVIPVSLFKDSQYEIYLRVKTTSSLQFPVLLWDQTSFWESDASKNMLSSLYLGAMGVMVLYNFALFMYLRERAYIYYVAMVVGTIGFQTGIDGFAYQLFFPLLPDAQAKVVSVSVTAQMVMAVLFAKHFLSITTQQTKLSRMVNVMLGLNVIFFICALLLPYKAVIQPASVVAAIMSMVFLAAGLYEWKQGNGSAKLFVFAWASLMTGVVILSLNKNGIFPRLFITENAMIIGTLGQAVLFSLALASRINQVREEKATATKEALVANQKAVENLRKYQTLFEESLEGMFKCNQKGEFIHGNPALAKMLGFEDVKTLRRSKFSFKEDLFADMDQLSDLFKTLRKTGTAAEFEAELLDRKRDYFWGAMSLRMVEDENGHRKFFEGSLRDITERREKEKAELEKKAAYEATQAKSYFLANMSHEIRTPLTAIMGFAEALCDSRITKTQASNYVATIVRSSQHLLHVINDILDLSKIEAQKLDVELVPLDLLAIVKEVQSCWEMKARNKGLNFNVVYEFPLPRKIVSDQTRLKQILFNLVSNALKFTDQGGITLTVFLLKDSQQIGFKVEDTGIGMSEDQQQKVFNAFTQADSSTTRLHGGTGLGLSIAKQLAELMGGGIEVSSEYEKGSCFEVLIAHGDIEQVDWVDDISEAGVQHEEDAATIRVPPLSGDILYAEDNHDNQELVSMLIKPTGASLKIVENGAEAMSEALKRNYDLILMDIQMPTMSGTTATRLLREHGYENPIVAITANLMDYEIKKYLEVGVNGYLAKPVNKTRFYEVLSMYLQENQGGNTVAVPCLAANDVPLYKGRVLVADDVEDNRLLFANRLEKYGIEVTTVADGAVAVEEALVGEYDLLLMDLNMPNMTGEEAVTLLRQSGFQEAIVALTAEDESATVKRLLGNGFDGHLLKPLSEEALEDILSRYLALSGGASSTKDEEEIILADNDFQELIDNYVAGLSSYVTKLNDAESSNNFSDIKELAHQLKGSGGSFGFAEISDTAKQLELAVKEENFDAIPERLAALLHEIGVACSQSLDDSIGNLG